jgi:hypothetical protein
MYNTSVVVVNAAIAGLDPGWPSSRDRCYYFLNIFGEKFGEKIGVFD